MAISDYLVNKMVEKNIINEDREIYIYGLNSGFTILINIITALFYYSFLFRLYHYVHTVGEYTVNLVIFAIYIPTLSLPVCWLFRIIFTKILSFFW